MKALPLALLLGVACAAETGTALLARVTFDEQLGLTQLQVAGEIVDGGTFGPAVRPERAARTLASGETIRILLTPPADGALASLQVNGLREGKPVAAGSAQVSLRERLEVEVPVTLAALPLPGGGGDPGCEVSCAPGQICVAGHCLCTQDSCDGCCQGTTCAPGTQKDRCGNGGDTCERCKRECQSDGKCS